MEMAFTVDVQNRAKWAVAGAQQVALSASRPAAAALLYARSVGRAHPPQLPPTRTEPPRPLDAPTAGVPNVGAAIHARPRRAINGRVTPSRRPTGLDGLPHRYTTTAIKTSVATLLAETLGCTAGGSVRGCAVFGSVDVDGRCARNAYGAALQTPFAVIERFDKGQRKCAGIVAGRSAIAITSKAFTCGGIESAVSLSEHYLSSTQAKSIHRGDPASKTMFFTRRKTKSKPTRVAREEAEFWPPYWLQRFRFGR